MEKRAIKRLSKETIHELLKRMKTKAEQNPQEEGSFRLEVICNKEDIEKND